MILKDLSKLSDADLNKFLKKYVYYVKALQVELEQRKESTRISEEAKKDINQDSGQSAKIAAIKKLMPDNFESSALNRSGRIAIPKKLIPSIKNKTKAIKKGN